MSVEMVRRGPAPARMVQVEAAGLSDVGQKRPNNEDSFGYDLDGHVFVVCDGMGGMAAGEVASALAVESALATYKRCCMERMGPEQRLQNAIASANASVWHMAQSRAELRGMGTTMVAACMDGNYMVVANVGDSRAYFLRNGGCVQITEDHSVPARGARMGGLITQAVGVGPVVRPDFFVAELQPEDIVLLATDGMTRYFDTDTIAQHVSRMGALSDVCRGLIAVAHSQGAEDNATCLLLRVL